MAIKDIEKRIAAKFPGVLPIEAAPPAERTVMQWITAMDDKVCEEYCRPLDGKQWELDDPNIPTAPDDTHPNCRCRLELVQISALEEPQLSEEASIIGTINIVARL